MIAIRLLAPVQVPLGFSPEQSVSLPGVLRILTPLGVAGSVFCEGSQPELLCSPHVWVRVLPGWQGLVMRSVSP